MSSQQVRPALTGFLNLAPDTSSSYPKLQAAAPAATTAAAAPAEDVNRPRRSSSVVSSGSTTGAAPGLRFLKLGPVHWGRHADGREGDWHEENAIEE